MTENCNNIVLGMRCQGSKGHNGPCYRRESDCEYRFGQ